MTSVGGLGAFLKGNGDGTFTELWPNVSGIELPEDARSVTVTDLNQDQLPDVVVTVSSGPTISFLNNSRGGGNPPAVEIVLQGPDGDPQGCSAVIELLEGPLGSQVARRLTTGGRGSYLSQCGPSVFWGLADDSTISHFRVVWGDGTVSPVSELKPGRIVVTYPTQQVNVSTPENDAQAD